jgi:hypothetical protein
MSLHFIMASLAGDIGALDGRESCHPSMPTMNDLVGSPHPPSPTETCIGLANLVIFYDLPRYGIGPLLYIYTLSCFGSASDDIHNCVLVNTHLVIAIG